MELRDKTEQKLSNTNTLCTVYYCVVFINKKYLLKQK